MQFARCLLLLLACLSWSHGQAQESHVLCSAQACGVVDRDGVPVIGRVFQSIEPLVGDLAVFKAGDHHGVVNRSGRTVLPARYEHVVVFADGRIWAGDHSRLEGTFFDAKGQVLQEHVNFPIEPPKAPPLSIVTTAQGRVLVNDKGQTVSDPYEYLSLPGPGKQSLLATRLRNGVRESGQLLLDGRFVTKPEGVTFMDEFFHGVSVITSYEDTLGKPARKGLIDTQGKPVMPQTYEEIFVLKNGLVTFRQQGRWGLADTHGRIRLPPAYVQMDWSPHHDMLAVRLASGKAGVIDGDGGWIVPPKFDAIQWVGDVMIAAQWKSLEDDPWPERVQLFSLQGEPVPAPGMRFSPSVLGDLALIRFTSLEGEQGLLDFQGRVVAMGGRSAMYLPDTAAGPYFLERDGKWGVFAPYGKELSPLRFWKVEHGFRNGRALADGNLLNDQGAVLASYESAFPFFSEPEETFFGGMNPCLDQAILGTQIPVAVSPRLEALCSAPATQQMLLSTQWFYRRNLAAAAAPLTAIAHEQSFRRRLLACPDALCALQALQTRLEEMKAKPLVPVSMPLLPSHLAGVPATARKQLRRQIGSQGFRSGSFEFKSVDINRDGIAEVLVTQEDTVQGQSIWLYARKGSGWRRLLASNYGAPTLLRGTGRAAWPDLVATAYAKAGEAELKQYRFTGKRYATILTCRINDADPERTTMFCDHDATWRP